LQSALVAEWPHYGAIQIVIIIINSHVINVFNVKNLNENSRRKIYEHLHSENISLITIFACQKRLHDDTNALTITISHIHTHIYKQILCINWYARKDSPI
jgi:hypothetical protein